MTYDKIEVGKVYYENFSNNKKGRKEIRELVVCKNDILIVTILLDECGNADSSESYIKDLYVNQLHLSENQSHNIAIQIAPVREPRIGEIWECYNGSRRIILAETANYFITYYLSAGQIATTGLWPKDDKAVFSHLSPDQSHSIKLVNS